MSSSRDLQCLDAGLRLHLIVGGPLPTRRGAFVDLGFAAVVDGDEVSRRLKGRPAVDPRDAEHEPRRRVCSYRATVGPQEQQRALIRTDRGISQFYLARKAGVTVVHHGDRKETRRRGEGNTDWINRGGYPLRILARAGAG